MAGRRTDGAGPRTSCERYRADVTGVVHTHLNETATLLVVEWWTPDGGLRRVERA